MTFLFQRCSPEISGYSSKLPLSCYELTNRSFREARFGEGRAVETKINYLRVYFDMVEVGSSNLPSPTN